VSDKDSAEYVVSWNSMD